MKDPQMLNGQAEVLYREGKYYELWKLMTQTGEGAKAFFQLCEDDPDLYIWFLYFQFVMWDEIFNDQKLKAGIKELFGRDGLGEQFDEIKKSYAKCKA
jgi:hypothetical protein